MKKLLIFLSFIFTISVVGATAQNRKSVGAAEVNGTFRDYFDGKYKGSYNEIKILSVGKGKLRVAFELTYPYIDGTGEMSANMGSADGTATIEGDTAVYAADEFGQCRITIKFVRRGEIKVTQAGADSECGFGHNVSASGIYKKSSGKPKF
ncbi:MAG: hypothetical protein LH472_06640 [Pyrinomonadaceae bacterium]|nr:hypothetical protein [Pyrinomonadaceae bacterium]